MLKKISPLFYAYAALLASTAIWAAAGPVIKLTLGYIPVMTFLFLRFLVVCVVTLPFIYIDLKRNPIDKKDIKNFIILGLLSQTSLIIPFYGYKFTSAIDAALIGVTYPIMAVAAGNYFYKEVVTKGEKIGIALATAGTLLIMLEPLTTSLGVSKASGLRIFGNVLILAYQLVWLIYIVWSKKVMGENSTQVNVTSKKMHIKPMRKKYSPNTITLITFFVGLASLTPLVILENIFSRGQSAMAINTLSTTPILGVLYMALLSSIVAYMFFQWGLHKVEVTATAMFTYLGPIFAFPAAYVLLREVPSPTVILGAGVITAGVLIAEKHKS